MGLINTLYSFWSNGDAKVSGLRDGVAHRHHRGADPQRRDSTTRLGQALWKLLRTSPLASQGCHSRTLVWRGLPLIRLPRMRCWRSCRSTWPEL